jgi:hypothetical protein
MGQTRNSASTKRIRLATLVSSVGYRNPAHLAKIAAGVDLINCCNAMTEAAGSVGCVGQTGHLWPAQCRQE